MKDQTLLNLYKKVAAETGLSERHVEHMIKYVFHDTRKAIAEPTGVDILIHELGNFKIPDGRIDKAKEVVMDAFNKKKMTESVMKKAIKRLDEKDGRKG
jgi:hypothetical protein